MHWKDLEVAITVDAASKALRLPWSVTACSGSVLPCLLALHGGSPPPPPSPAPSPPSPPSPPPLQYMGAAASHAFARPPLSLPADLKNHTNKIKMDAATRSNAYDTYCTLGCCS